MMRLSLRLRFWRCAGRAWMIFWNEKFMATAKPPADTHYRATRISIDLGCCRFTAGPSDGRALQCVRLPADSSSLPSGTSRADYGSWR